MEGKNQNIELCGNQENNLKSDTEKNLNSQPIVYSDKTKGAELEKIPQSVGWPDFVIPAKIPDEDSLLKSLPYNPNMKLEGINKVMLLDEVDPLYLNHCCCMPSNFIKVYSFKEGENPVHLFSMENRVVCCICCDICEKCCCSYQCLCHQCNCKDMIYRQNNYHFQNKCFATQGVYLQKGCLPIKCCFCCCCDEVRSANHIRYTQDPEKKNLNDDYYAGSTVLSNCCFFCKDSIQIYDREGPKYRIDFKNCCTRMCIRCCKCCQTTEVYNILDMKNNDTPAGTVTLYKGMCRNPEVGAKEEVCKCTCLV